jgi:hypothetical protein
MLFEATAFVWSVCVWRGAEVGIDDRGRREGRREERGER